MLGIGLGFVLFRFVLFCFWDFRSWVNSEKWFLPSFMLCMMWSHIFITHVVSTMKQKLRASARQDLAGQVKDCLRMQSVPMVDEERRNLIVLVSLFTSLAVIWRIIWNREEIFIWEVELQKGKKRQREIFHPLVYCPKWLQWLELNWSEARSFFLLSHMGAGVKDLSNTLSAAFPDTFSREMAWKRSS